MKLAFLGNFIGLKLAENFKLDKLNYNNKTYFKSFKTFYQNLIDLRFIADNSKVQINIEKVNTQKVLQNEKINNDYLNQPELLTQVSEDPSTLDLPSKIECSSYLLSEFVNSNEAKFLKAWVQGKIKDEILVSTNTCNFNFKDQNGIVYQVSLNQTEDFFIIEIKTENSQQFLKMQSFKPELLIALKQMGFSDPRINIK